MGAADAGGMLCRPTPVRKSGIGLHRINTAGEFKAYRIHIFYNGMRTAFGGQGEKEPWKCFWLSIHRDNDRTAFDVLYKISLAATDDALKGDVVANRDGKDTPAMKAQFSRQK